MSTCTVWCRAGPSGPTGPGIRPRAPTCSRCGRLSRHFRGGLVSRLRRAFKEGRLARITAAEVERVLNALMQPEWVVYSKPCLARTDTVIEYLGRYSHRIALSDRRLLDFDENDDTVDLRYKDYRDGSRHKVMTLTGEELIRRFLLHVLPKGFMRVRHFGFLANRCRARCLELIRTALAAPPPAPAVEPAVHRAVRRLSLSQVPHRALARHRAPGPAAAWSGGSADACHLLGTRAHPPSRTGRPRPALALAPPLENRLHFIPQYAAEPPCRAPRRPAGCRTEALRRRGNPARHRPATRPPGYNPLSERGPRPQQAPCQERISPTNVYPSCAPGVALRPGVSAARTTDKRLFVILQRVRFFE